MSRVALLIVFLGLACARATAADAPAAASCGAACAPRASPPASAALELNVEGRLLEPCSTAPMTGYFRSGTCSTGPEDSGTHVVCAQVTQAFLEFSRARGNDLITPRPELRFPGLVPGDRWCLCALRWREALEGQVAPPVVLPATNGAALRFVSAEALQAAAVR